MKRERTKSLESDQACTWRVVHFLGSKNATLFLLVQTENDIFAEHQRGWFMPSQENVLIKMLIMEYII